MNNYKQLYASKSEDTEEMNRFLDTFSLPKLKQEATNNLNRPKTRTEV